MAGFRSFLVGLAAVTLTVAATPASASAVPATVKGIDVSDSQPTVDWQDAKAKGVAFAYIKATEGADYRSPLFGSQHTGASSAGLIRGAYHFARPDQSSGAAQANHLLANGGNWIPDGMTLPPALDVEPNPDGPPCYGLSQQSMDGWIRDFSDTVHSRIGRYPVIYTTTKWWQRCTGNTAFFGDINPLWISQFAPAVGPLPSGWISHSFWQHSEHGAVPGNQNLWNGDLASLTRFARGS